MNSEQLFIAHDALLMTHCSVFPVADKKPVRQTQSIIGLVLFALFMSSMFAFPADIDMEYTLGFDGHFRLNHWTPITVRLENRGRSINGTLEIIVTSGSELLDNIQQTIYSMNVELPTHSNKLRSFSVLLDSVAHPLTIQLTTQGETLLSETLNLRPHYSTKPIILVSGDKMAPDDLPVLSDNVFPIFSYTHYLPETWYGYDGVEMVILHADVLKTLRPTQFQALLGWIRSGGYLITAGGLNTGSFSEQRMQQLMSVNISGFKEILKVDALKDFCGYRLESKQPFLVLKATIEGADIIVQEEGIPFIFRKRLGAGSMMLLGIDFLRAPFRNWPGRHAFWQKMRDLNPSKKTSSISMSSKNIRSAMMAGISTGFPKLIYIVLALGIYLILLKICFLRIEKRRGNRIVFISLAATILLFSGASLGLYLYQRYEQIALSNSFLRLQVSEHNAFASGHYTFGFYGFQQQEHRVRFSQHDPIISVKQTQRSTGFIPGSTVDISTSGMTVYEDDDGQEIALHTEKWSAQFLQLDTMLNFPMQGNARLHKKNLELHITNQTPYTITDCWFYFDGHLFSLGELPPDKAFDATFTVSDIEQAVQLIAQTVGEVIVKMIPENPASLLGTMKNKLLRDMLHSISTTYQTKPGSIYLFGWINSNLLPVTIISADVPVEGVTLVEWEIPAEEE